MEEKIQGMEEALFSLAERALEKAGMFPLV